MFKLVRTDTQVPHKIPLQPGVHVIGRGSLLQCDDKRVSRKHAQLEVTDDAVSLKALHANPCFYKEKGTDQLKVLKLNDTVALTNGDRFGLLPDSNWYEVVHLFANLTGHEADEEATQEMVEQDIEARSTTLTNKNSDTLAEEELAKVELYQMSRMYDTITGDPEAPTLPAESPQKPKDTALDAESTESKSLTEPERSTSYIPPVTQILSDNRQSVEAPIDQASDRSPKRCHSPEDSDAKRMKAEDIVSQEPDSSVQRKAEEAVRAEDIVKQEADNSVPQPGPSGDHDNASNVNKGDSDTAKPDAVAAPPGRERCWYGAKCYRKNPAHKADFAHPAGADWGTGDRGVCPYGGACAKRDPRHWSTHEHPPAAVPPPPPARTPGMRVVERHGNIFYVNAHTVNFYDDHVDVEDSDGEMDSVDFDYEF